jgi:hypothetical protein
MIDTRATDHYLQAQGSLTNVMLVKQRIIVSLPDDQVVQHVPHPVPTTLRRRHQHGPIIHNATDSSARTKRKRKCHPHPHPQRWWNQFPPQPYNHSRNMHHPQHQQYSVCNPALPSSNPNTHIHTHTLPATSHTLTEENILHIEAKCGFMLYSNVNTTIFRPRCPKSTSAPYSIQSLE